MKTQEEINELYHKCWDDFINKHDDTFHYYSFVEGYTQCQQDMANKKYTEEDMFRVFCLGNKLEKTNFDDENFSVFFNMFKKHIQSLNKQN